jgi:hypothetical protein
MKDKYLCKHESSKNQTSPSVNCNLLYIENCQNFPELHTYVVILRKPSTKVGEQKMEIF